MQIGLNNLGLNQSNSFSPLSLFQNGEQGALYDVSDISTMYQDSAGTMPAAVNQPVGLILDKRLGAVRGAELRAAFTNGDAGAVVADDGSIVTVTNGDATAAFTAANQAVTVGQWYELAYTVVNAPASSPARVLFGGYDSGSALTVGTYRRIVQATNTTGLVLANGTSATLSEFSRWSGVSVKTLPGNHATQATAASRPTLRQDGSGYYYLEFDGVDDFLSTASIDFGGTQLVTNGTFDTDLTGWTSTIGGAGTIVWNAGKAEITADGTANTRLSQVITTVPGVSYRFSIGSVESNSVGYTVGSSGLASQDIAFGVHNIGTDRVVTFTAVSSTTYISLYRFGAGVATIIDNVSVIKTNSDKMTVFAGVYKASDAATAAFVELSTNSQTTSGTFAVFAPSAPGITNFNFHSRGTASSFAASTNFAAPISAVITGLASISDDQSTLRGNGVQVSNAATDQGLGGYGNYPIYIGRRGESSLPFNGRLYILGIRGASTNSTQITQMERVVGSKMGINV